MVLLDPAIPCTLLADFEEKLMSRVVGQDDGVKHFIKAYRTILSGFPMDGPLRNMLFLGPTGSGKTRLVEAAAEILFGSSKSYIKIDCGEYTHSHEVAKLIGSPPGYLGYSETNPRLSQANLDQYHTSDNKFGIVLFDEIEKAHDSFHELLLGIFDRGVVTLGNNKEVDFHRTINVMTSNIGAKELSAIHAGGMGFVSPSVKDIAPDRIKKVIDKQMSQIFTPEFINRIDDIIIFNSLTADNLRQILDIELYRLQERIIAAYPDRFVILRCSPELKEFILLHGESKKYGARFLKRTIDKYLVDPIMNLFITHQLYDNTILHASLEQETPVFYKEEYVLSVNQNS